MNRQVTWNSIVLSFAGVRAERNTYAFCDGDRDEPGRGRDSRRVSDLRAHDLPELVLAGCALATGPARIRGVPRRLGRERRRVGTLGRACRGCPRGVRPAPA